MDKYTKIIVKQLRVNNIDNSKGSPSLAPMKPEPVTPPRSPPQTLSCGGFILLDKDNNGREGCSRVSDDGNGGDHTALYMQLGM
jgi:hypothetical protein